MKKGLSWNCLTMTKETQKTLVAHSLQTVEDVLNSGLGHMEIHVALPFSSVKTDPLSDYSLSNIKRQAIKNGVRKVTFSCKKDLLAE